MAALLRTCTCTIGARPVRCWHQAPTAHVAAPCTATAQLVPTSADEQAAEVGVHSLRCRLDDLPGSVADAMTDELLGLGALSARSAPFPCFGVTAMLDSSNTAKESCQHACRQGNQSKVVGMCSVEEFRPEGHPEQEVFGGGATREVWDRCSVAVLFSAGTDVPPILARLEALLGFQQPLRYEAGASLFYSLPYSRFNLEDACCQHLVTTSSVPGSQGL